MIIELAGPPCVGKTTLAGAFAERLQSRGLTVNVVLSFRPREMSAATSARHTPVDFAAPIYRLLRPLSETVRAVLATSTVERRMLRDLVTTIPPRTFVGSIRLQQYMLRLARTWNLASLSSDIAIFDQAFVQALYSLALAVRSPDHAQLNQAVCFLPRPDLLVRMTASREVLASRLTKRWKSQGMLEHLLEVNPETNLASTVIFDRLDDALAAEGFTVAHVDTSNDRTRASSLDQLEQTVASQLQRADQRTLH